MESAPVILCQPDNCKGCSVCCGLFNFMDCSREHLSAFLDGGSSRVRDFAVYDRFRLHDPVRDEFTHICPYQGFLSQGKPGCHIHPLSCGSEGRERSLFAAKICSSFLCPAHSILASGEKEALITQVKDWHLYSIAIADPESFSCLNNFISETFGPDPRSGTYGMLLNAGLACHAESLTKSGEVIFYYSIPEYILHRDSFCIRYHEKNRKRVIDCVMERAAGAGLTV